MDTGPAPGTMPVWQADSLNLALNIVGLVIVIALVVLVYRTMQRPRLYPSIQADGEPALTWQTIVRYLVTTPIMVLIWFIAILLVMSWAARGLTPQDMVVAAAAVVGAARLLAHLDEEMAHELGKTIPLAVIGVILISQNVAPEHEFARTVGEFVNNASTIDHYYWLLVAFDVLVTATWYGLKYGRWRIHRSQSRAAWLAKVDESVSGPWRAIRRFGRARS